ncbi:MAG: AAA family ATPase [Pedobacter sp.]
MYTKYFGFNEKPFTLTPNPRFIFLSKNHKEAFAHLLYGINNHYGFIELIGEVGTGKTTVLRTLLGQLKDENYRTALIFNPCLTGVELLRSINHEFGLNSKSEYANELLVELNRFLLAENAEGRTVVLVIDEAQNLKPEVLEQIRLISNLETENDKLIQIILAGQPELKILLERPELRQLNQRIAVRYTLKPMSTNETRTYIRHRMDVAGETGGVSFSLYAIKWIYLYTRGVPRMINILCDRALLIAYGEERRRISSNIVTRAIREIINIPQGKRLSLTFAAITATIIMVVVIALSSSHWLPARFHAQAKVALAKPDAAIPLSGTISAQMVSAQNTSKLEQEIISYDQNATHVQAFNALVSRWGAKPVKIFHGQLKVPVMFGHLAAKRNLRITLYEGSMEKALGFNLPILVETRVPGKIGDYCLAITSVGKNGLLSISPALFGSNTINKDELSSVANGRYYLVWRNSGKIPDTITPGEKLYEIRALQRLLKQADFYQDAIDGFYSVATTKAVREFQRSRGIPINDSLGELTLAALTKFEINQIVPLLKEK